jgi:large subunit ribosomal protein L23
MPLFGFRTHKKYDKDFSQEKKVKNVPEKGDNKPKTAGKIATKTKDIVVAKPLNVTVPSNTQSIAANVIIRPHVTEKSGLLSQTGTYTFQVSRDANKNSVSNAIQALYKVRPAKVTIINKPVKNIFVRGKKGTIPALKKAMVILKKGDKIEFI